MSKPALSQKNSLNGSTRPGDQPNPIHDRLSAVAAASVAERRGEVRATAPDQKSLVQGRRRSRILRRALLGLVVVGLAWGAKYYFIDRFHQSTDDAFIDAHVSQISAKVAAHVVRLKIDDNSEVRAGDLLLELDPRDFQTEHDQAAASLRAAQSRRIQAEAQVKVTEAQFEQAKAQADSAQATAVEAIADLDRDRKLRARQVIDQRDLDHSVANAGTSGAALDAARKSVLAAQAQISLSEAELEASAAQVGEAQAQLQAADLRLSYTRIYAPVSGKVTRKNVEIGDYVQPGQTLFAIVPHDVWVVANFKETQLGQMAVGQRVEVRVDAAPGRKLRGHIESLQLGTGSRFSLLPPENATGNYVKVVQRLPLKIVFDEPETVLRPLAPGMSVEPDVLLAPVTSLTAAKRSR